jgi:hypothetical protein
MQEAIARHYTHGVDPRRRMVTVSDADENKAVGRRFVNEVGYRGRGCASAGMVGHWSFGVHQQTP